jgi:hypothetical protein
LAWDKWWLWTEIMEPLRILMCTSVRTAARNLFKFVGIWPQRVAFGRWLILTNSRTPDGSRKTGL